MKNPLMLAAGAIDPVVTANNKLIEAGLSQDEIAALIQEAVSIQPTTEE